MSNSLIGKLARFTALVLLATLVLGVIGFLAHDTYNRLLAGVAGALVRIVEPASHHTRLEAIGAGIEVDSAYPGAARFVVDSLEMHLSAPLILALLLVGGPARRTAIQRGQRVVLGMLLVFAGHMVALIAQVEFSPLEDAGFRGSVYYIARFSWWVGTVWGLLVMPAAAALYIYLVDWSQRPDHAHEPTRLSPWKVFAGAAAVLVVWSATLAHLRPSLPQADTKVVSSTGGLAHFEAGRYADAAEAFRRQLREDPENLTLRFDLGVSLYRMGSFAEAVLQFEEVQRAQPDYLHLDITLGAALFDLGERDRAVAAFRQADLEREFDLTLLLQVGGALATRQDLAGAEAAYRQAVKVAAEDPAAHYRLGTMVMAQGRVEEAVPHFEQAVGLRRDYLEAWKYLALAHQQTGRLDRAAAAYHQALQSDPDDLAALAGLGTLLTRSEDPCMAVEFLERCTIAPGTPEQQAPCRELADQLASSCNS